MRLPATVPGVPYPQARREALVEKVGGHPVADPYRWLEDPDRPEVAAWSAAQDQRWASWIGGYPGRDALVEGLAGLVPGWRGAPHVVGGRRFWLQRHRRQDHGVLWVSDERGPRSLVDPNALSSDATVTLDGWSPSLEGNRVAYQLSSGGDEESALWVLDTDSGDSIDGPVDRTRYSPVAWLPGGRQLYFVRRLSPDQVPPGEEAYHRRLWLHQVGADPDTDAMVWGDGLDPTSYIGVTASDDGRWIAVSAAAGTAPRNDVWVGDLSSGAATPTWTAVQVGDDCQAWPRFDRRGTLWLLTDRHAPRRRLCAVDPAEPVASSWREVVPEDPAGGVLEDVELAGEWIATSLRRHGISEVSLFDRAGGATRRDVALPGAGSVALSGRPDEAAELWMTYTDFATPPEVWHLDPATGVSERTGADIVSSGMHAATMDVTDTYSPEGDITSQQIVVTSADGTEVRVTVVQVGGDAPTGPRPTILYGYGGFGVTLSPSYSSSILAWVSAGGIYAVAHLRGGSEEGEAWHRAGMREHKARVFEDFEAAADALVTRGWTTTEQLAIMGGSNGGLLVGAALTRSPERYCAAVCSAPLLDMVRYERFGLGATWNDEYGRAEDPTELSWLLGYSPYHRVQEGVRYPATLFTTFDGDSRVDPLHARKMCAALQWATIGDPVARPVLLRREQGVGHGARAVRRSVELAADQLAFLAHFVGLDLSAASGGLTS
jgi:prolyl oligopeptidase